MLTLCGEIMAENSDSKLIGEIDLLAAQNSGSTSDSNSLEFDEIEGICEQPPVGITPPTYDLRKPDKQSLVRDRARANGTLSGCGAKVTSSTSAWVSQLLEETVQEVLSVARLFC